MSPLSGGPSAGQANAVLVKIRSRPGIGTEAACRAGVATSYELATCPVCPDAGSEELADRESLRGELEELWAFHQRRLRPGTPPRHLTDRLSFTQRPPLRLARCTSCGTLYRDPSERADSIIEDYARERLDGPSMEALFAAQLTAGRGQVRRLARILGRPGQGVEVGSYAGGFLAAAAEAGWRFVGVDVNAAAREFARRKGLEAIGGTLETFEPPSLLDVVAIWNTFEQLPDPPRAARIAHVLLAPGGVFAVRVPNGAFYAALRERGGVLAPAAARLLLAHNNLLGFPYRHGFTPGGLRRLLLGCGFEVEKVRGDALLATSDHWTRPWAAAEERALKRLIRLLPPPRLSPWIEAYARKPASRPSRP